MSDYTSPEAAYLAAATDANAWLPNTFGGYDLPLANRIVRIAHDGDGEPIVVHVFDRRRVAWDGTRKGLDRCFGVHRYTVTFGDGTPPLVAGKALAEIVATEALA